jgi:hypothetical protein
MTQFKTLAEFKRLIQVGVLLNCVSSNFKRNEEGKMTIERTTRPTRPVSIKQGNAFTLRTIKQDGSEVDSWCYYPAATECKIQNNVLIIYDDVRDGDTTTTEEILRYSFA